MDYSDSESKVISSRNSPDMNFQSSYLLNQPLISSITDHNIFRNDLSQSQSRLSNSTYSKEYIKDIEIHRSKTQKYNQKKLESQSKSYDRIKTALTGQLNSLKQQLELNEQLLQKELEKIREEYDIRFSNLEKEKNERVESLKKDIKRADQDLREIQKFSDENHYDFEIIRMNNQDQLHNFGRDIEELNNDIEYHKELLDNISKSEVEKLNNQITLENQQHIINLDKLAELSSFANRDLYPRLEAKDKLIENLEYEIIELRNHILSLKDTSIKEISEMKGTMRTSQRVIEAQNLELKRMKSNQASATTHTEILSNEAALLENEYARLKRDNHHMLTEIKRLKDLVYGKNMESPLKPA